MPTELNTENLTQYLQEQGGESSIGDLIQPYLMGQFTNPISETVTKPHSYQEQVLDQNQELQNAPFPLNESDASSFSNQFQTDEGYGIPWAKARGKNKTQQDKLANILRVLHGRLRQEGDKYEMQVPRTYRKFPETSIRNLDMNEKTQKLNRMGAKGRTLERMNTYMNTPISIRTGEPMDLAYDAIRKNLNRWFKEKWVDVSRKNKDGKHPPCGRSKAKKGSKGYPKCRPSVKVSSKTPKTSGSMSEGQKQAATKRKRAKKQGVGGKPTIVKGDSMSAFNNAWNFLKALPEQQMFVERTRRQSLGGGEDEDFAQDHLPEIDRFGARSYGTIHPAIQGMLQRRTDDYHQTEGIPPDLNLDSGEEDDKVFHSESTPSEEEMEHAGLTIAQRPDLNRRMYDSRKPHKWLEGGHRERVGEHNPNRAAQGGPFDQSRYASGHYKPERFMTGYGYEPGHKISHPKRGEYD